MYISNLDDVVTMLRQKLPNYLYKKGIINDINPKKFKCFVHEDNSPSMCLNPKNNFETVQCFACHAHMDIFAAANYLDNLPTTGSDWVKTTIPTLCKMLDIQISLGEISPADLQKNKLFSMARDIADILSNPKNVAKEYMQSRKWNNEFEDCYSIDYKELILAMMAKGYDVNDIENTGLVSIQTRNNSIMPIVGNDMYTWIIKDASGRPCAFISRTNIDGLKYIHSSESPIFAKRNILYGLSLASTNAKRTGLWIVEGPGDRAQFLRLGYKNVVAVCGTALTEAHLHTIKSMGIKDIYLSLDWDEAGQLATERIVNTIISKEITSLNVYITKPSQDVKDPDELLCNVEDLTIPLHEYIKHISLFSWLVQNTNLKDMDAIYSRLIPAIAIIPVAIKRDALANELAKATGISFPSIISDIDRIRNKSKEERKERILAAADKYKALVEQDPDNIFAAVSTHEADIAKIESEYNKSSLGVNYQLSKFDALQELKKSDIDHGEFKFNYYTLFGNALSGGLPYAHSTLIYFGGRANAAKTATMHALAMDVALSDPDTCVIIQTTDDNYPMIEPRLTTTLSWLSTGKETLSAGEASNPRKGFASNENASLYNNALLLFRALIGEERLLVLDAEDGNNLTTLERTLKYIRTKYPEKKILVVLDNTYNLTDLNHLEATARMAAIANKQKTLTAKYKCAMWASAEYRKNMPLDTSKMKLPVNDDLADARQLMYVANIIIHVYNDLNDRGVEHAEIFWTDPMEPDVKKPRLALVFGKNKITGFKDKLIMDINPVGVTLRQVSKKDIERQDYTIVDKTIAMHTEYEED